MRWDEFLSQFEFIINSKHREKNGKLDMLLRYKDHHRKEESEAQLIQYLFNLGQVRLDATPAQRQV